MTAIERLPDDESLDELYGDAPVGVRANMVRSADGAAAFDGLSRGISSDTDHALLLRLRGLSDVVLVGSGTAKAEGYGPVRLDDEVRGRRRAAGQQPDVPIAIVTNSGRLDPSMRVFTSDGKARPIIVTSEQGQANLPDLDADVMLAGKESVNLREAMESLSRQGLSHVLCEGGPTLLSKLIEDDLVAELCQTISPLLAANQPTGGNEPSRLDRPRDLSLRHVRERDGMLFLRWSRTMEG